MTTNTIAKGYVEVFGITCKVCKENHSVIVLEKDLKKFESSNLLVQQCFPYLSSDGREVLLSGISGDCYTKYFGKEEDY